MAVYAAVRSAKNQTEGGRLVERLAIHVRRLRASGQNERFTVPVRDRPRFPFVYPQPAAVVNR